MVNLIFQSLGIRTDFFINPENRNLKVFCASFPVDATYVSDALYKARLSKRITNNIENANSEIGSIVHLDPVSLKLVVWKISSIAHLKDLFFGRAQSYIRIAKALPLGECIKQDNKYTEAVVLNKVSTYRRCCEFSDSFAQGQRLQSFNYCRI